MGEASTKRIATAPGSRIKDEVVVVFATVEIRDAMRRAAKELAGDNGAGIRLEVPRGLQPSLKALEAVSYNLKQKNNGIKRNIRFDDLAQELVLDFKTDPSGSGHWRRVTAIQAKQMKSKISASNGKASEVTDSELEGLMDVAQV